MQPDAGLLISMWLAKVTGKCVLAEGLPLLLMVQLVRGGMLVVPSHSKQYTIDHMLQHRQMQSPRICVMSCVLHSSMRDIQTQQVWMVLTS